MKLFLVQTLMLLTQLGCNTVNASPVSIEHSIGQVEHIRIKQVLDVMRSEVGNLNWHNTTDGGALLIVPTDEWERYEGIAKKAADHRTPEEKAAEEKYYSRVNARNTLMRRTSGEVPNGVSGKRVWFACHESGSWAQQLVLGSFVAAACDSFVGYLNTKTTQIFYSRTFLNPAGSPAQFLFKWTYKGYDLVTKTGCGLLLEKLTQSFCRGGNSDTRGGVITQYTSNVGSLGWGNEVVKAEADPTAQNCGC